MSRIKSGKERKIRRRARKTAEADLARRSYLWVDATPKQLVDNQRLLFRALREGWIGGGNGGK